MLKAGGESLLLCNRSIIFRNYSSRLFGKKTKQNFKEKMKIAALLTTD